MNFKKNKVYETEEERRNEVKEEKKVGDIKLLS